MARKLDQILVIDVESTCWVGEPPDGEESEIIEIGVCSVEVSSLSQIEKQSILVKPDRSTISDFCTELTALVPHVFKEAGTLADAYKRLKKEFALKDRLLASWGDYDRLQFERCCRTANVGYPFLISHLNVKTLFAAAMGLPHEVGLDTACGKLEMEMEMDGTHHRGDDDAWIVAGVLCELLQSNRSLIS